MGQAPGWTTRPISIQLLKSMDGKQQKKGLYLAVSLRGQAQGVFGNISIKSKDYAKLVLAPEERFAPPQSNQTIQRQAEGT